MKRLSNIFLLFLFVVSIASCTKPTARKPVNRSAATTVNAYAERNRALYDAEEQAIEKAILEEGLDYERSGNGFYYRFVQRDSVAGYTPVFGDRLTFEHDAVSIAGDTIYRKEELSPITKNLEQEYGIFKGMREALKLMKAGEVMDVYFPSYTAYGYYGDQNRIGASTPFKSRVTLLSIKKSKQD